MRRGQGGVLAFFLFAILVAANVEKAQACRCNTSVLSSSGMLSSSDVAFRGVVVERHRDDGKWIGQDETERFRYEFFATRVWKGRGPKFEIISAASHGECGVLFEVGETYDVYGDFGPTGELRTAVCLGELYGYHGTTDLALADLPRPEQAFQLPLWLRLKFFVQAAPTWQIFGLPIILLLLAVDVWFTVRMIRPRLDAR